MENPTLAKILKTEKSKLVMEDKLLIFSGDSYLVMKNIGDDFTDKEFDEAFDNLFYCGNNLNKALEIFSQNTK